MQNIKWKENKLGICEEYTHTDGDKDEIQNLSKRRMRIDQNCKYFNRRHSNEVWKGNRLQRIHVYTHTVHEAKDETRSSLKQCASYLPQGIVEKNATKRKLLRYINVKPKKSRFWGPYCLISKIITAASLATLTAQQ